MLAGRQPYKVVYVQQHARKLVYPEVVALCKAGMCLRDAAKKCGVSYGVAAKACREAGVRAPRPTRPLGPDGKPRPLKEIKEMRAAAAKKAARKAKQSHKRTRERVQERTRRYMEAFPHLFSPRPGHPELNLPPLPLKKS